MNVFFWLYSLSNDCQFNQEKGVFFPTVFGMNVLQKFSVKFSRVEESFNGGKQCFLNTRKRA